MWYIQWREHDCAEETRELGRRSAPPSRPNFHGSRQPSTRGSSAPGRAVPSCAPPWRSACLLLAQAYSWRDERDCAKSTRGSGCAATADRFGGARVFPHRFPLRRLPLHPFRYVCMQACVACSYHERGGARFWHVTHQCMLWWIPRVVSLLCHTCIRKLNSFTSPRFPRPRCSRRLRRSPSPRRPTRSPPLLSTHTHTHTHTHTSPPFPRFSTPR